MIRGSLFVVSFFVCACEDTTTVANSLANRSATAAVSEVLVLYVPEVSKPAVTNTADCIVKNSDLWELRRFAGDAVTGIDQATVALTTTVMERTETQTCINTTAESILAG